MIRRGNVCVRRSITVNTMSPAAITRNPPSAHCWPNRAASAANRPAVTTSMAVEVAGTAAWHPRQRPRCDSHDATGTSSNHRRVTPHESQCDRPVAVASPAGRRSARTPRYEPTSNPNTAQTATSMMQEAYGTT